MAFFLMVQYTGLSSSHHIQILETRMEEGVKKKRGKKNEPTVTEDKFLDAIT